MEFTTVSTMTPLIHCVRHAQGFHNISVENLGLPDPILTPFGEEQCRTLATTFPRHDQISLIVASPLTRTLQTALLSFGKALINGKCSPHIIALPELQETSDLVSDTGSDINKLSQLCHENDWPVDLSLVTEDWTDKRLEKWNPTFLSLSRRARDARKFIWDKIVQLQEDGMIHHEIVLVTHGGFLHYFTEDWEDSGVEKAYEQGRPSDITWDIPGTAWRNTEVRTYTMVPERSDGVPDPLLVELPENRARRGKANVSSHPRGKRCSFEERYSVVDLSLQKVKS